MAVFYLKYVGLLAITIKNHKNNDKKRFDYRGGSL